MEPHFMEKGENQNQKGFTTTTPPFNLGSEIQKEYIMWWPTYKHTCYLSSI